MRKNGIVSVLSTTNHLNILSQRDPAIFSEQMEENHIPTHIHVGSSNRTI